MAKMIGSTNINKAIEVIHYVHSLPKHNAFHDILLYADRLHLKRYGRQIYDEEYAATWDWGIFAITAQRLTRYSSWAYREANLNLLSESDIECLREAAEADIDSTSIEFPISLEAIVSTLPNAELLIEHRNRF